MNKIEKLTDEQRSRFPEFIEKWTAIGLTAGATDKPRAESAVAAMYAVLGVPQPRSIVWTRSPMEALRTCMDYRRQQRRLGDPLGNRILRDAIAAVGEKLRSHLSYGVVKDVREKLSEPVGNATWANVGTNIWRMLRKADPDLLADNSIYGQFNAEPLSRFDFYREVLGLTRVLRQARGVNELALSAGWAFPFSDVCVVSERPHRISLDRAGQLHEDNGPALIYTDGWALHAQNGIVEGLL